jgi:hypothetical protein
MSIQRGDCPRAETLLQFAQCLAAGVTQNEIKSTESLRRQIGDVFALFQLIQRDWRIEIIKGR